jgi:hypothetical protein
MNFADLLGANASARESTSVAIIVAIVALVSTIVGATIGAATNYILARRLERADKVRAAVEVKRAARLIGLELLWTHTVAKRCVQEKIWPADMPLHTLPPEARQKYLDSIAPNLSSEAWLSLTIALQAADTFRMILGKQTDRTVAIPDDAAETLVPLVDNMIKGRKDLFKYED